MAKIVVALLVLTLSTIALADGICKCCGYVKKHTHYPPYSVQLQEVIGVASKNTKIKLKKEEIVLINKIIRKEDGSGSLTAYNNGCYGLGQGKKATYKSTGVPWKTTCPVEQVTMILLYVKYRYKTFAAAWKHHEIHNWY